jgi:hypothetical protein
VVGVGSLEEEAYQKLGASHIQDGCYGGHIENTKSAVTREQTNGSIELKFLSWVDQVRIHDIIPGFSFDLLFEVTEVKVEHELHFVTTGAN